MNIKDKATTVVAINQPAFEYRSVVEEIGADLNQYGQVGWELVSVIPIPHDPGRAVYHFKRRRS